MCVVGDEGVSAGSQIGIDALVVQVGRDEAPVEPRSDALNPAAGSVQREAVRDGAERACT